MSGVVLLGLGALGAVVGSFLNVVADRVPAGESIVRPPSHCPACGRSLAPIELIPIFSYLTLKGRCRTCGARIPIRVLLVETIAAGLFVAVGLRFGLEPSAVLPLLYASTLLTLAVIDLEHHRIPNVIVLPAIAVGLLAAPLTPGENLGDQLLGGGVAFGALLLLAVLLPEGMGMGDVKLAGFVGLILGFPAAMLFLLGAFILGGLVAGALMVTNHLERTDPMPFGPFLALAGTTGMLWAEPLVNLWLGSV